MLLRSDQFSGVGHRDCDARKFLQRQGRHKIALRGRVGRVGGGGVKAEEGRGGEGNAGSCAGDGLLSQSLPVCAEWAVPGDVGGRGLL